MGSNVWTRARSLALLRRLDLSLARPQPRPALQPSPSVPCSRAFSDPGFHHVPLGKPQAQAHGQELALEKRGCDVPFQAPCALPLGLCPAWRTSHASSPSSATWFPREHRLSPSPSFQHPLSEAEAPPPAAPSLPSPRPAPAAAPFSPFAPACLVPPPSPWHPSPFSISHLTMCSTSITHISLGTSSSNSSSRRGSRRISSSSSTSSKDSSAPELVAFADRNRDELAAKAEAGEKAGGRLHKSRSSTQVQAILGAPLRAVALAWAAAGVHAGALWERVRMLRAFRMVAQGAAWVGHLPPVAKAIAGARGAVARHQDAAAMQVQAFWHSNRQLVLGLGGTLSLLLLYRTLLGITSLFVPAPLTLATHFNCLALSTSALLSLGLYMRWRSAVSVDAVCSMALSLLNSHPGALEVLGAPVTPDAGGGAASLGSVSAAAVAGGGVRFLPGRFLLALDFPPRLCVAVFGAKGSEAHGVVNVAVTKHNGKYSLHWLAVDVPLQPCDADVGEDGRVEHQRVFVLGTEQECRAYQDVLLRLHATYLATVAATRPPQ